MRVVRPSFEIVGDINPEKMLKNIEKAGRLCYKSEDRITDTSAGKFIANIVKRGHEAVIEHESLSVIITCDRGVSHEIVRHRMASYCQESTRYCNYSDEKFGNELTFIKPLFWVENSEQYRIWETLMREIEQTYNNMISIGATPEQARSILPNSLKTEIMVTMNLREWRHFFKVRTPKFAHPQMREIAIPILKHFKELLPVVFSDIDIEI